LEETGRQLIVDFAGLNLRHYRVNLRQPSGK
jgi:hypothetical protein